MTRKARITRPEPLTIKTVTRNHGNYKCTVERFESERELHVYLRRVIKTLKKNGYEVTLRVM